MDELLKSRNLASVSVRKQRMMERQRQKELIHQQREQRKRRLARYSEAYSTSSEASRSHSPDLDSSAETSSEYGAQTPDNLSVSGADAKLESVEGIEHSLPLLERDIEALLRTPTMLTPQPEVQAILLGASLSRPCDFQFDRFSTFMENPNFLEAQRQQTEEEDLSEGSDEAEEEEDYSPMQIATPVFFSSPPTRPTVVRIRGPTMSRQRGSEDPRKMSTATVIALDSRSPLMSTTSAFIRQESSDSHLNFGRPSVTSRKSSSLSGASIGSPSIQSTSSLDRSVLEQRLEKKPSVPRLSKLAHSRIHTIKQFIRPGSSSGSHAPAMPQLPVHHAGSFSDASPFLKQISSRSIDLGVGSTAHTSMRRSATDPNLLTIPAQSSSPRPRTGRQASSPLHMESPDEDFTNRPAPNFSTDSTDEMPAVVRRKKSLTSLRRRSGSFGQAFRLNSSRSRANLHDSEPPPVPSMIGTPLQYIVQYSDDSRTSPLPPPPPPPQARGVRTPSRKGSMMFSPRVEPVGLGLRAVI